MIQNHVIGLSVERFTVLVCVAKNFFVCPINSLEIVVVVVVEHEKRVVADDGELVAHVVVLNPRKDRGTGAGVSALVFALTHIEAVDGRILSGADRKLLQALCADLEGSLCSVGNDAVFTEFLGQVKADFTVKDRGNDGGRVTVLQFGRLGYDALHGGNEPRGFFGAAADLLGQTGNNRILVYVAGKAGDRSGRSCGGNLVICFHSYKTPLISF